MDLQQKINRVLGQPEMGLVARFGVAGLHRVQRDSTHVVDGLNGGFEAFAAHLEECLLDIPVFFIEVFSPVGVEDPDFLFGDDADTVQSLVHVLVAVPSGQVYLFNLK